MSLPLWATTALEDASRGIWKWDDGQEHQTAVIELLDQGEVVTSEQFKKDQVRLQISVDGIDYDWYVGSKRLQAGIAKAMSEFGDLTVDVRTEHVTIKVTKDGEGIKRSYGVKLLTTEDFHE